MATINGSAGNDTIQPNGVSAGVTGGVPTAAADAITGNDGSDLLDGGACANTILGGAGNDTIMASGTNETLDGGTGTNTIRYAGGAFVQLFLNGLVTTEGGTAGYLSAGASTDILANFTNAYGGTGNDTITGSFLNNTFGGGAGSNVINGGTGFDTIDYSNANTTAATTGVIVNLSPAVTVTNGVTAAIHTAVNPWGGTDTLSNISGAIGTAYADVLYGRTDGATLLDGGDGNDTLSGYFFKSTLLGGNGDDLFITDSIKGASTLDGDAGNDTLRYTGAGNLVISLGTATVAGAAQGFVSQSATTDTLLNFSGAYGGAGNDRITGTNGNDTISGGYGQDTLNGLFGLDTLDYSVTYDAAHPLTAGVKVNLLSSTVYLNGNVAANTAIDPWGFTDTLLTTADGLNSFETVVGTAFTDRVNGSHLNNLLIGGDGADYLKGAGGNDTVLGGAGNDTLIGDGGDDSIDAGSGNDSIYGEGGSDTIEGGEMTARNLVDYSISGVGPVGVLFTSTTAATVTKSSGVDHLNNINQFIGSAGADTFNLTAVATSGNDFPIRVSGGAGNDTITGNGGAHVIADYYGSAAMAIDLQTGTNSVTGALIGTATGAASGTDTLNNIHAVLVGHNVYQQAINDTISGSAGDDIFYTSGEGSRAINGRAGNDTFVFSGTSYIKIDLGTNLAGDGYTTHSFASVDSLTSIQNAYSDLGNDSLYGSYGDNILSAGAGKNTIDGRLGFDIVDYSDHSNLVLGPVTKGVIANLGTGDRPGEIGPNMAYNAWGGTDTLLNLEGAIGTEFADSLYGTNGNDSLSGAGGNDYLGGAGGNDTLIGGAGNDTMRGSSGNNMLDGGLGYDVGSFIDFAAADATWTHSAATGTWAVTTANGTDTLRNVEALRFSDGDITIAQQTVPHDINGNGNSDVVLQNANGTVIAWNMNGAAATTIGIGNAATFHVAAVADFSGDGVADLLWRGTDGALSVWRMVNGVATGGGTVTTVAAAWTVATTGDLNGDGKADIVWQNGTTGEASAWLMNGTSIIGGGSLGVFDQTWKVVGTGDFGKNGTDDLVWQNSATGSVSIWEMNGATAQYGATVATPGIAWKVAGIGDFNSDGKSDLLFRNTTDGTVSAWTMNGMTPTGGGVIGKPGVAWDVAGVGDYNADGGSDILWRNTTTGETSVWLLHGLTPFSGASLGILDAGWTIA